MPIKLSIAWTIVLNVIGWPVIHLAVAKLFLSLPGSCFGGHGWLFRYWTWERDGHLYERFTGVRRWKQMLPDGAPFLRGFAKKKLQSNDSFYLAVFIRETCRGELAHWVMMTAVPVFFLWNPPWADGVMCLYAIAANLPCIITQRYNRIRLRRVARA